MRASVGQRTRVSAPGTITDFATEQIRDRIVLGLLPASERLPVGDLAEELGISRVPLREAVRQLEAEGLVDNVPRRGTIVRGMQVSEIYDTLLMMARIEGIAVERAVEGDHGTLLLRMRESLDLMEQYIEQGQVTRALEFLEAHRLFHYSLFAAAGEGGILCQHLCMMWNTAERYVNAARTHERIRCSHQEHRLLLEAIEAGDAAEADKVLLTHVENAWISVREMLVGRGFDVDDWPETLEGESACR